MPIPLKNQTIEQLGGSETVGFNTEDSQTHTHTHTQTHTHTNTNTARSNSKHYEHTQPVYNYQETDFRTDFTYKMGAILYTSLNYKSRKV